ncbi:hypothetical protein B5S31_g4727 [[Candida] boidinii]|nr:hypothetical protein B5S31_g4727 [[Candida] boidinii]
MLKLDLYFIFSILLVQGIFATKFLPSDFGDIQIIEENIDSNLVKRDDVAEEKRNLLWWLDIAAEIAYCKPVKVPQGYNHCPSPYDFDKQFTRGYDIEIFDENYKLLSSTWDLCNLFFDYYGIGLLSILDYFRWNCWFNPVKFHARMNFYFKAPKSGYFTFATTLSDSAVLGIGIPQNGCCDYNQDEAHIFGYENKYTCYAQYKTEIYLEEGLIYPIEVIFNAVGKLNQKFAFQIFDDLGCDMNCYFYRPPTKWCPATTPSLPTTTTENKGKTTTTTPQSSTIIITDMPTPSVSGYFDSVNDEPCFVLDLPKEWVDFEFEEEKSDGYVWDNQFYFYADGTTIPAADYSLSADQSTVSFAYSSVFSTDAAFTACGSITKRTDYYNAVYTVSAKYGSIVVKRDGSEETVLVHTTTTVTLTPVVTDTDYIKSVAAASATTTAVVKRDDDPVVQVVGDKKVIKMNPIVVLDPNYKEDKRDVEAEAIEGVASSLTLSKIVLALSVGVALLL